MFKFLNKNKGSECKELYSCAEGKVIKLGDVKDDAFASKALGDGIAIDVTGDYIYAPCDGVLSVIFNTKHAFMIKSNDDLEVLVHIGIDTVELGGEGFEILVEAGTEVKAKTPIIKIDNKFIRQKGYMLSTPIIVTNMDAVDSVEGVTDKYDVSSEDVVIRYKKK